MPAADRTDQHHGLSVSGFREVIQTQDDLMLRTPTGGSPERQDKPQHRQQNKHSNQSGYRQEAQADNCTQQGGPQCKPALLCRTHFTAPGSKVSSV